MWAEAPSSSVKEETARSSTTTSPIISFPPHSVYKSLAQQRFRLNNIQSPGLHEVVPIVFKKFNFVLINAIIHSVSILVRILIYVLELLYICSMLSKFSTVYIKVKRT